MAGGRASWADHPPLRYPGGISSHVSQLVAAVLYGIDILVTLLAGRRLPALLLASRVAFVCDRHRSACEMPACTWPVDEAEAPSSCLPLTLS